MGPHLINERKRLNRMSLTGFSTCRALPRPTFKIEYRRLSSI